MKDALGFQEYIERFAERHNLRTDIIYDDDMDIVDGIDGSKTILTCHMFDSELSEEQKRELDEKIYKYFETHYPFNVYEAYANFPSEEAYMDYAEFKWSRIKDNPYNREEVMVHNIINNDCPYHVSPKVYENVIVKIAVKYYPKYFPTEDVARMKIKVIDNPPISGKYAEIAVLTEMKSGPITLANGYRCLYCRPKMSYTNGFKYGDYFNRNNQLIRQLDLQDIKAVFEYKNDPNILLISGAGVGGFITTLEMITEDAMNNADK